MPKPRREYDARAWVVWLLVTAVLTLIARHPLYLIIIFLAVQLVEAAHAHPDNKVFKFPIWRLAPVILLLSAVFNMLSIHFGSTVLFALPEWLPLLGGIVTLEAAVFGLLNGLVLLTLLAVFMAFNQIVPVHALIALIPRALHDLGVVLLIALTYIPQTQRHLQQVREAQAIRGHRLRGWRDWRPLILPLLIGGLERAMGLAEAMVARGYGATQSTFSSAWMQLGLVGGLAGGLIGWVAALWLGWPGWLLMGTGVLLVAALMWRRGLDHPHTRYRGRGWFLGDSWLLAAALAPAVILLLIDSAALAYTPYPTLRWPTFQPLAGLALALIAAPALLPTQGALK